MEILFATSNSHKVSEAEGILGPLGHTVLPLLVDGSPLQFVEPQADGIEEVAFSMSIRARGRRRRCADATVAANRNF